MVRGRGLVGRAVAQFEARHGESPNSTLELRSTLQPVIDKVPIEEAHAHDEVSKLRAELRELREHNELLEFRLLEKQSAGSDNVSDSGVSEDRDHVERVLSLVTSRGPHKISTGEHVELLSPLSMHESGIFDSMHIETESRATQTEEDGETDLPDLRREVQKLLRFRETVCSGAPDLLQRLGGAHESENRPCSQCQALVQLVTKHEETLKDLGARCEHLSAENRRLDEERCELEEAENDARHISQRLETRVTILHEERTLLREELRRSASERAAISRQARRWETLASQLEERNFELEECDVDTRHRLSSLVEALPGLLAFAAFLARSSLRRPRHIPALLPPTNNAATQTVGEESEVAELRARVLAYSETLRLADQLWADTERQHQSRLQGAESTLTRLRDRVVQLEEQVARVRSVCGEDAFRSLQKRNETLQRSERRLQQHVHELESAELALREELRVAEAGCQVRERRLNNEALRAREDAEEARNIALELQRARDELSAQLTASRRRSDVLRSDAADKQKALQEVQQALAQEEARGRTQRRRAATLLAEAECTNSELREEVDTLETSVRHLRSQLEAQRQSGERTILRLNLQLSARDRELHEARRELEEAGAHEAGLAALAQRAALAAHQLQGCSRCGHSIQPEVREVASQLRALADIVSGERRHSELCSDSSPEEDIEDEAPRCRRPLAPGSRVRAAQRALLRASKPPAAIQLSCSPRPAELVAR